ncbi:MAG TPA: sulfotransferase [Brevundimonas sp.]|nr:sulfotransferase [Brevundimonas sp.]
MPESWARAYLEGLDALEGRDHVTDKMPRNLESVGLITRLFPDAPILLIRRDPVETCLSLYRQEFSRDWSFAHGLVDLGRAYGLSARFAAHWAGPCRGA